MRCRRVCAWTLVVRGLVYLAAGCPGWTGRLGAEPGLESEGEAQTGHVRRGPEEPGERVAFSGSSGRGLHCQGPLAKTEAGCWPWPQPYTGRSDGGGTPGAVVRLGAWCGGPAERPGRGQEAGGQLRRRLREGAVVVPHARGHGLWWRARARGRASWRSFPAAELPCSPVSICSGSLGGPRLCFSKPVRDLKGQAGRTLPRVGQRGSVFPHHGCHTVSSGSGTAVVGPWAQKDLGPLCRGHAALGLGSPVTCCVQLQGPSPSRALSGASRAPAALVA